MYQDQLEGQFKKLLGYKDTDTLASVRGSEYRDVTPESLGLNKGERIAVIYASGEIGSGSSQNSPSGNSRSVPTRWRRR
jgi:hypothetical protein